MRLLFRRFQDYIRDLLFCSKACFNDRLLDFLFQIALHLFDYIHFSSSSNVIAK
ncbi:Uncharacterised protein [Mycobacteroides abscessus subsp. abscessus]|nr:Uncharacterised protein [Mycobacteroides abscessus subsp. abscessus]